MAIDTSVLSLLETERISPIEGTVVGNSWMAFDFGVSLCKTLQEINFLYSKKVMNILERSLKGDPSYHVIEEL